MLIAEKCGVFRQWQIGDVGITLGLMRLQMQSIGCWTRCSLLQRNRGCNSTCETSDDGGLHASQADEVH